MNRYKYNSIVNQINLTTKRAPVTKLVERWTCDWKAASSNLWLKDPCGTNSIISDPCAHLSEEAQNWGPVSIAYRWRFINLPLSFLCDQSTSSWSSMHKQKLLKFAPIVAEGQVWTFDLLYRTGRHGDVTETRNTIVLIGSLIID